MNKKALKIFRVLSILLAITILLISCSKDNKQGDKLLKADNELKYEILDVLFRI